MRIYLVAKPGNVKPGKLPVPPNAKPVFVGDSNARSLRPDLQKHIGLDGDLAAERPVVAGDQ